jgi:hypothetical protein
VRTELAPKRNLIALAYGAISIQPPLFSNLMVQVYEGVEGEDCGITCRGVCMGMDNEKGWGRGDDSISCLAGSFLPTLLLLFFSSIPCSSCSIPL